MPVSTSTQTISEPTSAKTRNSPLWHVILLDDDDHTYEYVVEMLRKLFAHSFEASFAMAKEVDTVGRVIVMTAMLEHAELKRDQIHSYGRDWRLDRSAGSMSAILEPAPTT